MDFVVFVNFGLLYREKLINSLFFNLLTPTVLTVELPNFSQSFFMVPSYLLVLHRTIDPLGSPWWTSPFPQIWSSKNDGTLIPVC